MPTTDHLAIARSCSNIAFVKYWGNRDPALRLPTTGSISMNLQGIETTTRVRFADELESDNYEINGEPASGEIAARITRQLDIVRAVAGVITRAQVVSSNNFPMGVGIASSASAFAALSAAAAAALELKLSERELSALARRGSGSACRSIPGGFVEWYVGQNHDNSFAATIAPPQHWNLVDLIAVVSREHKKVGSSNGHRLAHTSPLQKARISDSARRLDVCRDAIHRKDFDQLAHIIEQDALIMHSIMMTSKPPLIYLQGITLDIVHEVRQWRASGLAVAFTIDAGPNVHVICEARDANEVRARIMQIDKVDSVLFATPGGPTEVVSN